MGSETGHAGYAVSDFARSDDRFNEGGLSAGIEHTGAKLPA